MSNTAQYTPTVAAGPWRIGKDQFVYDAAGHFVCVSGFHHTVAGGSYIPAKLNTAFIVRACNAHDHLVAAVKGSHQAIDRLMARLIELDPTFMPSKSDIWPALKANGEALAAAGAA